jgi:hypothetical protein
MPSVSLENAVEAADIVAGLRQYGITQDDVASVAEVTSRAVRGWKSTPRLEPYDRLSELRTLVVLLADSLTPRGVGQWLHARNRLRLGGERPLELLSQGEFARVDAAAHAFVWMAPTYDPSFPRRGYQTRVPSAGRGGGSGTKGQRGTRSSPARTRLSPKGATTTSETPGREKPMMCCENAHQEQPLVVPQLVQT